MTKKSASPTHITVTRPTFTGRGQASAGQILEIGADIEGTSAALLLNLGKARPTTAQDRKAVEEKAAAEKKAAEEK